MLKPNELDSACWRPFNLWHFRHEEDMVVLAVALLEGIVRNHPFIEGNKRTALVAARTLLIRNGYDIDAPDDELGPLIKDLAAGHVDRHDVEDAFQRYLISL